MMNSKLSLNDALKLLEDRDKRDSTDSLLIEAFQKLIKHNEEITSTDNNKDNSSTINDNIKLKEELSNLTRDFNGQSLDLKDIKDSNKSLRDQVQVLKEQNSRLRAKVDNMTNEIAEKNRLFELINDESLSNRIQLNVLSEEVIRLKQENQSLVKRWMERSQKDIETLNNFNELQDNFQR